MKISIDQLGNAIEESLHDYHRGLDQEIKKKSIIAAKRAVETLNQTSPKDHDEYAQGWGFDKTKQGSIVSNETNPNLTHLLENGHQLRQGGWSPGYPHIKPVEEQGIKEFIKDCEDI